MGGGQCPGEPGAFRTGPRAPWAGITRRGGMAPTGRAAASGRAQYDVRSEAFASGCLWRIPEAGFLFHAPNRRAGGLPAFASDGRRQACLMFVRVIHFDGAG